MSTVWNKKITADEATRLGAGFAAAATTPRPPMPAFNPHMDEKSGTILFAAGARSTTSSNLQLFFGPQTMSGDVNKPPTLSIKVSAPSEDFEDPDMFAGGKTSLAKDLETIAAGVGPHSDIWSTIATNFPEMVKTADPTGAKFSGFRKMSAEKLTTLLADDALRGSDKQVTMHKPQFVPVPIKKYHKKPDDNGDFRWVVQASFDVKLFTDRGKPISQAEHEEELERYHPSSSLREFAEAHPELMPSRFMFAPLMGGGRVPWTTALYGPYDSVSMHGAVHFKPHRVGLYAKFERVTYMCYVDQIDVHAMIGSSGASVAETHVNSAQQMLLAAAMAGDAPTADVVVEEEDDACEEPGTKRKAKDKGGGKHRKK